MLKSKRLAYVVLTPCAAAGMFAVLFAYLSSAPLVVPEGGASIRIWSLSIEELLQVPPWPTMYALTVLLATEPFIVFILHLVLFVIGLAGYRSVATFYKFSALRVGMLSLAISLLFFFGVIRSEQLIDFAVLPWFLFVLLRGTRKSPILFFLLLSIWSCLGSDAWLAIPIYLFVRSIRERPFVSAYLLLELLATLLVVVVPSLALFGNIKPFPFSVSAYAGYAVVADTLGLGSPDFIDFKLPALLAMLCLIAPFFKKRMVPLELLIASSFFFVVSLFWERYLWVFSCYAAWYLLCGLGDDAESEPYSNRLQGIIDFGLMSLLITAVYFNPINILRPLEARFESTAMKSAPNLERVFVDVRASSLALRLGLPLFLEPKPYESILSREEARLSRLDDYTRLTELHEGWEHVVETHDFDAALLRSKSLLRGMLVERLAWTEITRGAWNGDEWSLLIPSQK